MVSVKRTNNTDHGASMGSYTMQQHIVCMRNNLKDETCYCVQKFSAHLHLTPQIEKPVHELGLDTIGSGLNQSLGRRVNLLLRVCFERRRQALCFLLHANCKCRYHGENDQRLGAFALLSPVHRLILPHTYPYHQLITPNTSYWSMIQGPAATRFGLVDSHLCPGSGPPQMAVTGLT